VRSLVWFMLQCFCLSASGCACVAVRWSIVHVRPVLFVSFFGDCSSSSRERCRMTGNQAACLCPICCAGGTRC
jgi:hypothetical protein